MVESASASPRAEARRRPYRPERLAVATDTGENVDACFGKTDKFLIYQLKVDGDSSSYEFLEARPGPRPCQDGAHDLAVLEASAELLRDCGLVLAGRIGPAAVKVLSDRGVMALAAHLPIDEALSRLAKKK
jgi:predicted Fe-Mo cluster-binding NifX family protein